MQPRDAARRPRPCPPIVDGPPALPALPIRVPTHRAISPGVSPAFARAEPAPATARASAGTRSSAHRPLAAVAVLTSFDARAARATDAAIRKHPQAAWRVAAAAIIAMIVTAATQLGSALGATPGGLRPAAANLTPSPTASPRSALAGAVAASAPPVAPFDNAAIDSLSADGIPKVALNAYRVAAARMRNAVPRCGVSWYLLAGIGREESDHGRLHGATLHANGLSTPPIVGPALDGVHWAYVPAPPNGRALDGDATYAHALGPMQFIPSTWAIYRADADGDGVANVFDIDDASLGAARYLCAVGKDLRTHAHQARALFAYNNSDEYVEQVLALSEAYRRGVPITGLPVGITNSPLPRVKHHGPPPPVNPAAPNAGVRPPPVQTVGVSPAGGAQPVVTTSTAVTGRPGGGGASTTHGSGTDGTHGGQTSDSASEPGSSSGDESTGPTDPGSGDSTGSDPTDTDSTDTGSTDEPPADDTSTVDPVADLTDPLP